MSAIHSRQLPILPPTQALRTDTSEGLQPPIAVTDAATKKVSAVGESQAKQGYQGYQPQRSGSEAPGATSAETKSANAPDRQQIQLLNEVQKKQVQELQQRDREVKTHEAAHLAAAGQHATSGARFSFVRGPDGRSYAVGGSVGIDTSPEADPQATIRKADQIRRAALAPAEPSGQDRSVAAAATSLRLQAQAAIVQQEAEEQQHTNKDSENAEPKIADSSVTGKDKSRVDLVDGPSTYGIKTDTDSDLNHSDDSAGSCEVCGGAHGSEGHVAANQEKIDNSYLAINLQAPDAARSVGLNISA